MFKGSFVMAPEGKNFFTHLTAFGPFSTWHLDAGPQRVPAGSWLWVVFLLNTCQKLSPAVQAWRTSV